MAYGIIKSLSHRFAVALQQQPGSSRAAPLERLQSMGAPTSTVPMAAWVDSLGHILSTELLQRMEIIILSRSWLLDREAVAKLLAQLRVFRAEHEQEQPPLAQNPSPVPVTVPSGPAFSPGLGNTPSSLAPFSAWATTTSTSGPGPVPTPAPVPAPARPASSASVSDPVPGPVPVTEWVDTILGSDPVPAPASGSIDICPVPVLLSGSANTASVSDPVPVSKRVNTVLSVSGRVNTTTSAPVSGQVDAASSAKGFAQVNAASLVQLPGRVDPASGDSAPGLARP
ncbi:hypothetical protein Q8A73_001890 [Channa argus]|nr:hypothetical protein Q8A73_001890 [Channa argus]